MEISEKLQNQVRYFCDKISKVEWSGVLFYTTEGGTYGDPGFKIIAQEVYLMDIDTPVFTSYKFDGAFVKMLMENPRLRSMKKGHVHSHQQMSVFFSGTDTTEIMDNSEFHNYYFSLIVNNVNDMTAKVAYRVHRTSITTNELTYNDINGSPVTTSDHSEVKDDTVMIYDCDITKPFIPDAATRNRFCTIKSAKQAIQLAKQVEFSNQQGRTTAIGSGTSKSNPAWMARHRNVVTPNVNMTPGTLFDVTIPETKPSATMHSAAIRGWMIDLIGKGEQNKLLSQILSGLNIVGSTKFNNVYLHDAFTSIQKSYWLSFPEDTDCSLFNSRLREACTMLNHNYGDTYGALVNKITKKLLKSTIGAE